MCASPYGRNVLPSACDKFPNQSISIANFRSSLDTAYSATLRQYHHIYADSDVYIVTKYNSVYDWNIAALSQPQLVFQALPNVAYTWKQFYALVLESLQSYFGATSLNL